MDLKHLLKNKDSVATIEEDETTLANREMK